MKECPILMSAPMVLASLDDSKTQTRRIIKPQPDGRPLGWGTHDAPMPGRIACPYGQTGDRLWVRETWGYRGTGWTNKKPDVREVFIEFKADNAKRTVNSTAGRR